MGVGNVLGKRFSKAKIRRKMKRLFCTLFIMLIALAGCGSSSVDTSTLTVWAMGGEGESLGDFVTPYEEETGVDVEVVPIPWDQANEKLTTALASGEGPDVVQMGNTWMTQFGDAGAIEDLTKYADGRENFNLDLYFDGASSTAMYDDTMYSIPWYVDTRALYVRTDIVNETCGSIPDTQEELLSCSIKLSERGEGQYGMNWNIDESLLTSQIAWDNGWEFTDADGKYQFDAQEYKDALSYLYEFKTSGATFYDSGLDTVNTFLDGSMPMFDSGPWMAAAIEEANPDMVDSWTIVPYPSGSVSNATVQGGTNWTIWSDGDNKEGAADFINWMMSSEQQTRWFEEVGSLPARKDVWEQDVFQEDEYLPTWEEQLKVAKAVPTDAAYANLSEPIIATNEKVILTDGDIDEAVSELQAEADELTV